MNYKEATLVVDALVDGLGKHIDHGIAHAVRAFQVVGLKTSGSCEGHLHRGLPYPWIDLDAPEDRATVDRYLKEFNQSRSWTRSSFGLKTVNLGSHGAFRIHHYKDIRSPGIKNQKLLSFLQAEMFAFADFLLENGKE